jgi:hypothetical protein
MIPKATPYITRCAVSSGWLPIMFSPERKLKQKRVQQFEKINTSMERTSSLFQHNPTIFIVAPCILKIHKLLKPTNALICVVLF